MNSILQELLHSTPLRNYFLSDKHNRGLCQQQNPPTSDTQQDSKRGARGSRGCRCGRGRGAGGAGSQDGQKICVACDLDALFSSVFSRGDRKPYSPTMLLHSWWRNAGDMASYEQHDAHEFFISFLDSIHEMSRNNQQKLQNTGNGDCCIAHKVFSSILRSDVMCLSCGFTSTTYDPCVDISLDLDQNKLLSAKPASRIFGCSPKTLLRYKIARDHNSGISTLVGCLDHYVKTEKLGPHRKFFCQECQEQKESMEQISIRKLPLVSCFHIKRFEHSPQMKMSSKVDRYLQFPFSLDMRPYLSSLVLKRRFGYIMFLLTKKKRMKRGL